MPNTCCSFVIIFKVFLLIILFLIIIFLLTKSQKSLLSSQLPSIIHILWIKSDFHFIRWNIGLFRILFLIFGFIELLLLFRCLLHLSLYSIYFSQRHIVSIYLLNLWLNKYFGFLLCCFLSLLLFVGALGDSCLLLSLHWCWSFLLLLLLLILRLSPVFLLRLFYLFLFLNWLGFFFFFNLLFLFLWLSLGSGSFDLWSSLFLSLTLSKFSLNFIKSFLSCFWRFLFRFEENCGSSYKSKETNNYGKHRSVLYKCW
jgi:hypothetical protein